MMTSPVGNLTEITLSNDGEEELDELHGYFYKTLNDANEIFCEVKCWGKIIPNFSCKIFIPSDVFTKATLFTRVGLKRNLRDNTLNMIWGKTYPLLLSSN